MEVLCTFSGGFGDILWSLATVKEISRKHGTKVDMMTMLKYESLVPLLLKQSYIRQAIVNYEWVCTGSPHGDQPWLAPLHAIYDMVYHLTYRRHPGFEEPLIDFIATPHLIKLENPIPFIETVSTSQQNWITYAFNDMYKPQKDTFLEHLKSLVIAQHPLVDFVDVSKLNWTSAAYYIKHAIAFVGCRSSNYVLAHGVGQKNILVYEPHPNRNANGQFGKTFGNPYHPDVTLPIGVNAAHVAWTYFNTLIDNLITERINRNEISEAQSR